MPAGLAAAHDLALIGFRPTIFKMEPGGFSKMFVSSFFQIC